MPDTGFFVARPDARRAATMYQLDDDDTLQPRRDGSGADHAIRRSAVGGAGLLSTADDYLRFARMLLAGGDVDGVRVLSEESVRLMRTDRLTDEQKQHPFLGMPYLDRPRIRPEPFGGHRPGKSDSCSARAASARSAGRAPTAPGGRPIRPANLILMYLIQNLPDSTRRRRGAVAGNTSLAKLQSRATEVRAPHLSGLDI